jgi:hypothetical protein
VVNVECPIEPSRGERQYSWGRAITPPPHVQVAGARVPPVRGLKRLCPVDSVV